MKKFLLKPPEDLVTPAGHRFRILRHFCKGCRICVEFCPTGTLALDDRFKVIVAHPEKCIGCRMCELRCPDLAIYVTRNRTAKAAKNPEPGEKERATGPENAKRTAARTAREKGSSSAGKERQDNTSKPAKRRAGD